MRYASQYMIVAVLLAASASAQQRPIFDPDDFVDPRQRQGHATFISRLVIGGASNLIDDYRPIDQNAGFVHVANSFYWSQFEVAYKHSELRGQDMSAPARALRCPERINVSPVGGCNPNVPPIIFPTRSPPNATPAAPPPGSKDTLQFGWYHKAAAAQGLPVMLRYRLTWSRQPIDTVVTELFPERVSRRSGREQSYGLDADTYVRIGQRDVFGALAYARTRRSGTADNRAQNELTYTARLPGTAYGRFFLRSTLIVGGVSDRGGTAINVVNPHFEAMWHERHTRANVHLVYSPQFLNSGAEGWETHHQIAFFIDRALLVHLFE